MYSTIRFTSQGSNEVLSYILTYWNTILDFYQSIKSINQSSFQAGNLADIIHFELYLNISFFISSSGFRGSHHCHQDLQGVLF